MKTTEVIIQQYDKNQQIGSLSEACVTRGEGGEDIRIEYISRGGSQIDNREEMNQYCRELEQIIVKY